MQRVLEQGLAGKRVLVTGGTRGIGRATVFALASAGADVVVGHRTPGDEASGVASRLKEYGDRHQVVAADVTTPAGAEHLLRAAAEALGGLDVLVNNVGVDGAAPFSDLEPPEWHRVLDHNVTSAYLVTRAALNLLVDGGSVVNVGASVALRGRPNGVHYTAGKAALIGLTRGLCKDLGPRGIRVNTVAPGVTETEPGAGLPPALVQRLAGMTALGRLCRPEDVAGAVLFLAGDTSRYVTGATLNVDGGI
ncbi:MAG: 3-oxoacyl-[acyl-carrier protein] reductase [uncultured Pseudonocardia sp.]|uniref:3-oxoacyl-[acyl-carrier protein] reductase n=1 Tax=uncultured Pseudonocardia sp. TaxID=211455 RepID=A0A6J4QUE8_9PSEU|nr:MAG: 3-oxoacyl-[acyl-carrier protein] reductase [uncultured Pseudonocardia sp.]